RRCRSLLSRWAGRARSLLHTLSCFSARFYNGLAGSLLSFSWLALRCLSLRLWSGVLLDAGRGCGLCRFSLLLWGTVLLKELSPLLIYGVGILGILLELFVNQPRIGAIDARVAHGRCSPHFVEFMCRSFIDFSCVFSA